MKTALRENTTKTFNELKQVLARFREEDINIIPFKDSWTVGQVAEHIIKSLGGLKRIAAGNTEVTKRKYDEKLEAIKKMFSDYGTKLKSPEFLIPSDSVQQQKALLHALEQREKEMKTIIETSDLTLTFLPFELPTFGTLTGYEWVNFYLIHTQRHTHQLKKIYQALKINQTTNDAD